MKRAMGALILVLLSFAVPLLRWQETFGRDWDYFNALSLIVRSNYLSYGRFPLHDPWMCGGLDLLAIAQSRIFSPMGLLDIALPPHLANLFSLILYAWIGVLGSLALFRRLGTPTLESQVESWVLAILWLNCSWFSLHYAEGHIPFGAIQLLPWVVLATIRIREPRWMLLFGLLLALFLNDGGIYAFIYSLYLALTVLWTQVGGASFFSVKDALRTKTQRWFAAGVVGSAGLLCAAKVMPLFFGLMRTTSQGDRYWQPLRVLARVLFDPIQVSSHDNFYGTYYFHEYGCYFGIVGAAVFFVFLGKRDFRKKNKRVLLGMALWFWVAAGILSDFNPWAIHRLIPVLNVAHVQSRMMIFVFLLFLILMSQVLPRLRAWRSLWLAILVFLPIEFYLVRAYTFQKTFELFAHPPVSQLIRNKTVSTTVERGEKPLHYFFGQQGSRDCYEPAFEWNARIVVPAGSSGYRGEVYPLSGDGEAHLLSYTPGQIRASYRLPPGTPLPAMLQFNTNHLGGWRLARGAGQVVSRTGQLLAVQVTERVGVLELDYVPAHLPLQLLAYTLGLIGFVLLGYIVRFSRWRHQNGNSVQQRSSN